MDVPSGKWSAPRNGPCRLSTSPDAKRNYGLSWRKQMMRNGNPVLGPSLILAYKPTGCCNKKISTGKQGFDLQKRVFPVNEFLAIKRSFYILSLGTAIIKMFNRYERAALHHTLGPSRLKLEDVRQTIKLLFHVQKLGAFILFANMVRHSNGYFHSSILELWGM